MHGRHEAVGNDDYLTRRDLHPRTGDCAAFSGRTSSNDISPRSDYHDDVLTPFQHGLPTESQHMPSEADVELEGVTADGGLALNVGFDSTNISSSTPHPEQRHAAEAQVSLRPSVFWSSSYLYCYFYSYLCCKSLSPYALTISMTDDRVLLMARWLPPNHTKQLSRLTLTDHTSINQHSVLCHLWPLCSCVLAHVAMCSHSLPWGCHCR